MSELRLVTPPRPRRGWCGARQRPEGFCNCHQARYPQRCQSCDTSIEEGHCVYKASCGWVHTSCPGDERRGQLAILQGLNPSVRHDNLLETSSSTNSAKRRLTYGEDDIDSTSRKAPRVTQSMEDTESEGVEDVDPVEEEEEAEDGYESESPGEARRTREQQAILSHTPRVGGEPVCVNALAGCGKTTTIAMLCNHLHDQPQYANWNILYLVFGKKNREEAKESQKFPKTNMEIRTTHAFCMRHYFGTSHQHCFNPQDDYTQDDIIETVDLRTDLQAIFPDLDTNSKKFNRILQSVATYVRKTVHKFQASDQNCFTDNTVHFWAKRNTNLGSRSAWRNKIPVMRYQGWANTFFKSVIDRCHRVRDYGENVSGISHDGYLKVAQLEADLTSSFQIVVVDEAQDMTPCQADLFWGADARKGRAIYLFGDPNQQLFRFRGASDSFHQRWKKSPQRYTLTGSFRFGKEIAEAASLVLKVVGDVVLEGRAMDPGTISHCDSFENGKGVVLCRTNQGCFEYLFFNSPSRWCYLDGRKSAFPKPPEWVYCFESFLRSLCETETDADSFTYKNESFATVDELKAYIADEGDATLHRYLSLLEFLKAKKQTLKEFIWGIERSFCHQGNMNPDDYPGIMLGTVHKAKGLEFERVMIYRDFRFCLIDEATLSFKRMEDEANVLYVAITRAKKHLFLSADASECLQRLSQKYRQRELKTTRLHTLEETRLLVEDQWDVFKSSRQVISDLQDIPWPCHDESNPLGLDSRMSEGEQRSYLRRILLRYHPDKFLSAYGGLIDDHHLAASIKKHLHEIVRSCNEALHRLQNIDEC